MRDKLKTHWREILVGLLLLGNLLVWYVVAREDRGGILTVSYLDVGQGDAIFIDSPSGIQVLIDGGKGKKVLAELGRVMPFYDHSIDVVIATHPDQDHIEGLIGVEERYKTLIYIEPGLVTDKPFHNILKAEVSKNGTQRLVAKAGQRIELGKGAYLEIIFPDLDVSTWQADTNKASVVAKLVYGKTSFLFSGDLPIAWEDYLAGTRGSDLDVDVLKVGHHGSRTSSGDYFLSATSPTIAVISAGKDNSYGHPHKEVLERLTKTGAQILSTIDLGTITIKSNGTSINF